MVGAKLNLKQPLLIRINSDDCFNFKKKEPGRKYLRALYHNHDAALLNDESNGLCSLLVVAENDEVHARC